LIYKSKTFISAVVYVHNDENGIGSFIKTVYEKMSENFEKFEIICVNDFSKDNSCNTLKEVVSSLKSSKENCMVSILNMSYYQGLEASMQAGIDLAIGDFVLEFDGVVVDYDPKLIIQVFERSLEGYDIVSCGKGTERAASKLFYTIYNRFSGTQHMLRSETFRIISRRGINRVESISVSLPYRKAMYNNCGLKIDYIEYKPTKPAATDKRPIKNPHDTALSALMLFSNIAYKVTISFTLLMILTTIAVAIYVLTAYLMGIPIEGWTTMMLFFSGAFFALFAIMTMVVKYLSLILGLVFSKQKYMIESIEKITEDKLYQ